MAAQLVSREDRRAALGVGHDVPTSGGPAKVVGIARDSDGRVLVCLDHGDHRTRIPWIGLAKAALSIRPAPASDALDEHSSPMLQELPEDERAAIIARYRHLLQIAYGSPRGDAEADRRAGILNPDYDPSTTTLGQRLMTKARELRAQGERGVSKSALYRQLQHLDEGPDFLIHGNKRTISQRLDDYDPAVLELVRAEVDAEKHLSHKSRRKLLSRMRAKLSAAGIGEELTRHQLEALVGELSRGLALHHPAKTRRSEASRPTVAYGAQRVSRPGEIVQVDATPTTVALLGPLGVLIPAVILSAIDVYTRHFVALRVCVGAATSRDVCALISQMGRPTVTRAGYPFELEMWHGIPKVLAINDDPEGEKTTVHKMLGRKPAVHPCTIVFDHGSENASDHVMRYAAECGSDVVFCPPRKGHAKGVVEAVHRVLGGVESAMPIHKGANVLNRPNDLELAVPIRPQDLQDMLWEYIIEIYSHEEHRGLTDAHGSDRPLSPAMVWSDYVTAYGQLDAPSDPWVFLKGLERQTRLLSPAGIRLNKVTYNSSDLQELRSVVMAGIGTAARKLTVFFDRLDVTRIYLVHPVERRWMVVPRALDRRGSVAPMSGLARQRILAEGSRDTRRPLTESELHEREAELLARWFSGVFTDRQDARFAAIEGARQRTFAHDLEQASEEVLALAFPGPETDAEVELQQYPGTRDDDEEIDYDEEIEFDDGLSDFLAEDATGWGLS